jgi:hypothetical protein
MYIFTLLGRISVYRMVCNASDHSLPTYIRQRLNDPMHELRLSLNFVGVTAFG